MSSLNEKITSLSSGARLAAAAALVAVGAAGGAGAISFTRPPIQMAPTIVTPIAKLGSTSGIVTIKGRIAEIYGDRALVTDGSGKTMVDMGRSRASSLAVGNAILVQGRFDDGELRGSFLVGPGGNVEAIGPAPRGSRRPGPDDGPGKRDLRAVPPPPAPDAAQADCAAPVVAEPKK